MNCIKCELIRARLKASALALVGWSLERIAEHLSGCYGEAYSVGYGDGGRPVLIVRESKLPPFEPYIIFEGVNNDT